MKVITLLTDFGLADTYVGQMKGAILAIAPTVTLVDVTHAVPPQDVLAGAFLLWTAVEAFPPGSLHLAVVDPGVGSARRPMAMTTQRGDVLVGPDNGLLMPAAERLGAGQAFELTVPSAQVSPTFHGRDVFAPGVAHLANGTPISELGCPIDDPVPLVLPRPHGFMGEVLHVDTYGNLVTNLPAGSLPASYAVRLGSYPVPIAAATHYAEGAPGGLLALVGSAGLLEISARDASAAAATGAGRGAPVTVEPL